MFLLLNVCVRESPHAGARILVCVCVRARACVCGMPLVCCIFEYLCGMVCVIVPVHLMCVGELVFVFIDMIC